MPAFLRLHVRGRPSRHDQPRNRARRKAGRPWRFGATLALVIATTAGCGALSSEPEGVRVVTTVAPVTDLVLRVGGDRVSVTSLVPAGQNSHTYQPRPSDVRALADADLYIDNGFGLNDGFGFAANENLPEHALRLELADATIPAELWIRSGGLCHYDHCHATTINPHVWLDPEIAVLYAQGIAAVLSQADGDGETVYQANAEALIGDIRRLGDAIELAVATIPQQNRKLVVYHDAWSYFAKRFGMEVIGAIQPVNFAQPSAAEVAAMIEQIQLEKVPAFFGSEVFPTDVMSVIAEQTGSAYVPELADEMLPGESGSPEHSYVGLLHSSARLIVVSLGGDPAALDRFEFSGS